MLRSCVNLNPSRRALRIAASSVGRTKRIPAGCCFAPDFNDTWMLDRTTFNSRFATTLAVVLPACCWTRFATSLTHVGAGSGSSACRTQFISGATRARLDGELATASAIAASLFQPRLPLVTGAADAATGPTDAGPGTRETPASRRCFRLTVVSRAAG